MKINKEHYSVNSLVKNWIELSINSQDPETLKRKDAFQLAKQGLKLTKKHSSKAPKLKPSNSSKKFKQKSAINEIKQGQPIPMASGTRRAFDTITQPPEK